MAQVQWGPKATPTAMYFRALPCLQWKVAILWVVSEDNIRVDTPWGHDQTQGMSTGPGWWQKTRRRGSVLREQHHPAQGVGYPLGTMLLGTDGLHLTLHTGRLLNTETGEVTLIVFVYPQTDRKWVSSNYSYLTFIWFHVKCIWSEVTKYLIYKTFLNLRLSFLRCLVTMSPLWCSNATKLTLRVETVVLCSD